MGKTGKKPKKKDASKKVKSKKVKDKKINKKDDVETKSKSLRGIVRIAGKDLKGELKLNRALLYVRGISHSLRNVIAKLISKKLGIPYNVQIGSLTDEQIESIDNILMNLSDKDLPAFLLNRRKDMATGENVHVIMNELAFAIRQDIEFKKKTRTWQGYRHMRGKKVRGQRTKNTGRRGLAVGVVRKK